MCHCALWTANDKSKRCLHGCIISQQHCLYFDFVETLKRWYIKSVGLHVFWKRNIRHIIRIEMVSCNITTSFTRVNQLLYYFTGVDSLVIFYLPTLLLVMFFIFWCFKPTMQAWMDYLNAVPSTRRTEPVLQSGAACSKSATPTRLNWLSPRMPTFWRATAASASRFEPRW